MESNRHIGPTLRGCAYVILALTSYFVSGVVLGWVLSLAEVKLLILGLK